MAGACLPADIEEKQLDNVCPSEKSNLDHSKSKGDNHCSDNKNKVKNAYHDRSCEITQKRVDNASTYVPVSYKDSTGPCMLGKSMISFAPLTSNWTAGGTGSVQSSNQTSENNVQQTTLPDPEVDQSEINKIEPLMKIIDKIADGERVPPQTTMRYEMLRFCTLRSFPKRNKPYITRIAQAGFYFANTDDEVVCYCCARRKKNWCENDIPLEIHKTLNPNCSFLVRNSELNVPVRISENYLQEYNRSVQRNTQHTNTSLSNETVSFHSGTPTRQSVIPTNANTPNDTQIISSPVKSSSNELFQNQGKPKPSGNFVQSKLQSISSMKQEQQPNSDKASHDTRMSLSNLSMPSHHSAKGNNGSSRPKYTKYTSYVDRVTSFNDCRDMVLPPDRLATSGFFYAGFGDCVRCFQCGVGLRHWATEDDPWIEHSRWSKDCLFIKQVKGQEFVNLVQMAVQIAQDQHGKDTTCAGSTAGTNGESSTDTDVEHQMQTDAAQSVLEMGYHPNIIRKALRKIKDKNDDRTLCGQILMEQIFEFEDECTQHFQQTSGYQPKPRKTQNTVNINTHSQEALLGKSHGSSINANTQSVTTCDMSRLPASSNRGALISQNDQNKKSNFLEQKKLKEENEQMRQQSLCTKCKTNDVCIVFLPCGHLVTCETCASAVRYCLVQECGKYIKGTVRTYLA